jgi:hypothetical protein
MVWQSLLPPGPCEAIHSRTSGSRSRWLRAGTRACSCRRSERPAASSAAPDVWTSPPARSAALRSSTRIECDDRVNVSRVKKAVDDWINQTAQTVEVNVPEGPKLGNALAGRPKWVAGRPHRESRSGAW